MTTDSQADPCQQCPLNREVKVYLEVHERRITSLETDIHLIHDFMIESKTIRYMTMGGGLLSIVTLVMTLINLLK